MYPSTEQDFARQKELRKILFDKLKAQDIVEIVVVADGSGDQGDIVDITLLNPSQRGWVYNDAPYFSESDVNKEHKLLLTKLTPHKTAEDIIKNLAYQVLDDQRAPDWQNNHGGQVIIRIDVDGGSHHVKEGEIRATYQTRVVSLRAAEEFSYDALSLCPLDKNPAADSSKIATRASLDYIRLQADNDIWGESGGLWVEIAATDDPDDEDLVSGSSPNN